MPVMANITVKKADLTTDITYTALAGSSGEKVPAVWRQEDASLPAALRPSMKQIAKGGNNGKRTVETLYVRPIVQTIGGVATQVGTHTVRTISVCDYNDAQTSIDEAVVQATGLTASVICRNAMKEGYAPRG